MKIANPIARIGEDAATNFLKKKGFTIIERNFRKGYGEIDIVCLDPKKEILVFAEVKTRSSNSFGTPFEAITYYKLRELIKMAAFYKHTHRSLPEALRIDAVAVSVLPSGEVHTIEHMENISGF